MAISGDEKTLIELARITIGANTNKKVLTTGESLLKSIRVMLGDCNEPFRWDNALLVEFANQGVSQIRAMRPDVAAMFPVVTVEQVSSDFFAAVTRYVIAQVYQIDSDLASQGRARSDISNAHLDAFSKLVSSVAHYFTDDQLYGYLKGAVAKIKFGRPDTFQPVVSDSRFADPVLCYIAGMAFLSVGDARGQAYIARFESGYREA